MYENAGKYILLFKGYLEDVLLKGTREPFTHAALVTNGYIRIFQSQSSSLGLGLLLMKWVKLN